MHTTIDRAQLGTASGMGFSAVGESDDTSSPDLSTRGARSIPASIPRSQRYFWTTLWQAGEREADEDLRLESYRDFTDPLDAIRWLLSDDS